ncbi:M23 family metallopeptidase [candidate division WOR-3 bacterium]|nr:M23 family metallopeptidase [candidate division WOR-3 bacterium]
MILVLSAQNPGYATGTKADDEETDDPVTTPTATIDLNKRLERPTDTLNKSRTDHTKKLKPADLRIEYKRLSPNDPHLRPTISLIDGLIQQIALDKDTCEQGEVTDLHVTAVIPLTNPRISFLRRTFTLFMIDSIGAQTYRTTLAIPLTTDPGHYQVLLSYDDEGEEKEIAFPFEVIAGAFSEDDTAELDVPMLTAETQEMLRYEHRYFAKAYQANPKNILYSGDFIWPCAGSITGMYGTPRKYNDEMDGWSHKAIDIANTVGTKVYAPNDGIVAMAKNLDVHGKSIVIAHGGDVHSVLLHLDEILVEKGDKVKKGQLIGKLGKTGLCTGPNLHWQVMVNRVPTNPRFWIQDKPDVKKGLWVTSDRRN